MPIPKRLRRPTQTQLANPQTTPGLAATAQAVPNVNADPEDILGLFAAGLPLVTANPTAYAATAEGGYRAFSVDFDIALGTPRTPDTTPVPLVAIANPDGSATEIINFATEFSSTVRLKLQAWRLPYAKFMASLNAGAQPLALGPGGVSNRGGGTNDPIARVYAAGTFTIKPADVTSKTRTRYFSADQPIYTPVDETFRSQQGGVTVYMAWSRDTASAQDPAMCAGTYIWREDDV